MAPLVLAGLSLLPKIPAIWGGIAGMFGKKVPAGVAEATDLASDVMNAFKKGEVPPEVQLEMEKLFKQHEKEMAELALEEKKLDYTDLAGVRELEMAAYKSEDTFVRQTRPKILRDMFKLVCAYALYAPLCLVAFSYTGLDLGIVIPMVKEIFVWLSGTFSLAYLGYAGARSIDKKNPDNGSMVGKIAKMVTGRK